MVETPLEVWNKAEGAFREFLDAQPMESSRGTPLQDDEPVWTPPTLVHYKVCCDAAFEKKTGRAAAAGVALDSTGAIIIGASECFHAASAASAEAQAMRLGISMALNPVTLTKLVHVCG
ncbi:hypothetical protein V6N11_053121 [Hibiscus sabdariffa]|uniref:RNase H type-1 domain-containing protein n=1 Tax=Hibiscus sabdariffa TaxID=183260 RepID=A0ABR2UCL2_9ROSI